MPVIAYLTNHKAETLARLLKIVEDFARTHDSDKIQFLPIAGTAGIGLKVATLPVHALGVGVGVDYALYLLSVQLAMQRQGATLAQAYGAAVGFTGRVVALIGITMAAGVITWVWSPIKFQADMGLLLAFMFVWNMIGALVLIPALSYFFLRRVRPVDPIQLKPPSPQ